MNQVSPLALAASAAMSATLRAPAAERGYDPLTPTIFHERWWLEAASGGDIQEAEVRAGNQVVARMPYVFKRSFPGQVECTMPELTHFLGPAIDLRGGTVANRNLKHYELTKALLAQIPACGGFTHSLHGGTLETMAFADAGFSTLVQFTLEVAPQPEAALWRNMRDKTRNVIRRAQERWEVTTLDDPHAFAAFYHRNLRDRCLINNYKRIAPIAAAALDRGAGRILAARSCSGELLGAIFVVWDQSVAYYLMATRSLVTDNSVMAVLVWQAMRQAAEAGRVFDFDGGLQNPGSRLFLTGFGGQLSPRYLALRRDRGYLAKELAARAIHRTRRWALTLQRRAAVAC